MAEVNPESNKISNSSLVTGSFFSSQILAIQNKQKEVDSQNEIVIQQQRNTISLFGTSLQSLRSNIDKLTTGLSNIAFLLQKDGLEEQNRIRVEQERERILAEQEVRTGKENQAEQKIQNAVVEPVEKIAPKMENVFSGIKRALELLFFGWLTNEVVQGINDSEEKTTTKFNDIKFNIVKNIGIGIGGLIGIRTGFNLIKNTVGIIGSKLSGMMIGPLRNLIPNRPGAGRNAGLFGSLATVATGLMNWANGENMDAVLAAASILGPFKFVRIAAGLGFGADQIAELFGMNIFGEDPEKIKQANQIKEEAQKQSPQGTNTDSSTSNTNVDTTRSTPSPSNQSQPVVSPQQTLMGESVSGTPRISEEKEKQFEMAWKYRNNSMARGRIEGAWNNLSAEEQQQAMEWAKTKGYNWEEMKLTPKPVTPPAQVNQPPTAETQSQTTSTERTLEVNPDTSQQTQSAEIIQPAQISIPPKPPQEVGNLPEPQPIVTMISSPNANQSPPPPPITNGPLTDVPLINSSNPDNFYVLYSQFNYNVVI